MIILDQLDYEYFVKKQFQLNFVIDVLAMLFIFTMATSDFKTYLLLLNFSSLLVNVIVFFKIRYRQTVTSYALHRIFGQLNLSIQFLIITLVLASEAGLFFILGIIISYIVFALNLYAVYKIKFNQSYFDSLSKNFNQDERLSLYAVFQKISNNHWNRMKPSIYHLVSLVGFTLAVLIIMMMLNISNDYAPYFIIFINFTLSFYILFNLFYNGLVPYYFIKNYDV